MSEVTRKNKALMRRIYEVMWNKGQPAWAAEIFMQPAGVERFVSQFLKSFPDLQHTVEDVIADGDRVAIRFTAKGTHSGTWMDFSATGKTIQLSVLFKTRVAHPLHNQKSKHLL